MMPKGTMFVDLFRYSTEPYLKDIFDTRIEPYLDDYPIVITVSILYTDEIWPPYKSLVISRAQIMWCICFYNFRPMRACSKGYWRTRHLQYIQMPRQWRVLMHIKIVPSLTLGCISFPEQLRSPCQKIHRTLPCFNTTLASSEK